MHKKSVIFLTLLIIIIAFLAGVRYGQNVEKTNKVIDFIISLTPSVSPTKTPSPTPMPTTEYKSKRWGLKFKYPANLEIKESTNTPEIIIEEKPSTKSAEK